MESIDKRTKRSQNYKRQQQKKGKKVKTYEALIDKENNVRKETIKETTKKVKNNTVFILTILKRITHFLASICYLLISIYGIICIPIIYGYKPLVVLSGSMEPTFKVGSIIYYQKVEEAELKVNDVVTFSLGSDTFITHRIVDSNNGLYQTKGDANNAPDVRKINYDNIHGKVTNTSIPFIGYYINFVNNHLYILGIIILILVSEFLLGSVKALDIDKMKERK